MEKILSALSSTEVLALTLIGEARGEPIEGIIAVGCVIRNRVHMSINKGYMDICLADKQFSCWNKDDPNYNILLDLASRMIDGQQLADPHYRQCVYVAKGIFEYSLLDNTFGAENYMTVKLFNSISRPKWARAPKKDPINIGNHSFFNV